MMISDLCYQCQANKSNTAGLCTSCIEARKSQTCKTCGHPGWPHAYRHPFESSTTNWDKRFLDLAAHVAGWSKDPSTKVGAVIVDNQRRILSMGYNGFPRGVDDSPERYTNRTQKYPRVVHAELNAILNTGVPMSLEGSTIYSTHQTCMECAKSIIQSGIGCVVVPEANGEVDPDRWGDSIMIASEMFEEAGVELRLA